MRIRLLTAAVLVAAAGAAPAEAAEVVFRFSSVVGGNGTSVPGTALGEPVEIIVIADNGGESILGQAWDSDHHRRTEVRVGDGFDLSQTGAMEFFAETDSSGAVVAIDLFKSPGVAVGSGGTGGGMALTVNGARNIVIDGVAAIDARDLTVPANWTVERR